MAPTKEEPKDRLSLWTQFADLKRAGKDEEAMAFRKANIPLEPWGAAIMKKFLGVEAIRTSGYDLSEVEAKFGKEWLNS